MTVGLGYLRQRRKRAEKRKKPPKTKSNLRKVTLTLRERRLIALDRKRQKTKKRMKVFHP